MGGFLELAHGGNGTGSSSWLGCGACCTVVRQGSGQLHYQRCPLGYLYFGCAIGFDLAIA